MTTPTATMTGPNTMTATTHASASLAPPGAFISRFEVRVDDLSPSGHINNVAYLRFLDEARFLFCGSELGENVRRPGVLDTLGDDVLRAVVQQCAEYRREVWYTPAPIEVRLWVPHLGTSSFVIAAELLDGTSDDPAVVLESTMVVVDRATRTALPLPDEVRARLAPFAGPRPQMRPRSGLTT